MQRRSLLTTLLFAPAIIKTPGLIMPIKPVLHVTILTGETIYEETNAVSVQVWKDLIVWDQGESDITITGAKSLQYDGTYKTIAIRHVRT